jgi:hypothetical protein
MESERESSIQKSSANLPLEILPLGLIQFQKLVGVQILEIGPTAADVKKLSIYLRGDEPARGWQGLK